jgi:hypothetical protein
MLGKGLDRDKLLHDGTMALMLQANFGIFDAPEDPIRWFEPGIRLRRGD